MKNQIEKRIREIAKEEGVNPDLAVKVAECESGLNPGAINWNRDNTTDRGLYQWNSHWHPEIEDECAFSVDCSTRAFSRAVVNGRLDWWFASELCWKAVYKQTLISRILSLWRRVLVLWRKLLEKH